MKIYLSHDLSSQQLADVIRQKIEGAGNHQVLSEKFIQYGEHIPHDIAKMLDEADAFVMIVSKEWRSKEWLAWEWRTILERTWEKQNIPIIGVVTQGAEVPPFLQVRQYITISDPSEIYSVAKKILELLNKPEVTPIEPVEEVKKSVLDRLGEITNEISKFTLTNEDLERQKQWLVDKIERVASVEPNSLDVAKLQVKLADTIKAIGKSPEVVEALKKGLDILEQNKDVPPRKLAQMQTKLATALRDVGENEAAVQQICNALKVCGVRTNAKNVKSKLQQCRDEVPVLTDLLSETITYVNSGAASYGRKMLETLDSAKSSIPSPAATRKQQKGGVS